MTAKMLSVVIFLSLSHLLLRCSSTYFSNFTSIVQMTPKRKNRITHLPQIHRSDNGLIPFRWPVQRVFVPFLWFLLLLLSLISVALHVTIFDKLTDLVPLHNFDFSMRVCVCLHLFLATFQKNVFVYHREFIWRSPNLSKSTHSPTFRN